MPGWSIFQADSASARLPATTGAAMLVPPNSMMLGGSPYASPTVGESAQPKAPKPMMSGLKSPPELGPRLDQVITWSPLYAPPLVKKSICENSRLPVLAPTVRASLRSLGEPSVP